MVDKKEIVTIIQSYPKDKSYTLAILQDIQKHCNYIPKEALELVADYLGLKEAAIYSLATFYRALSLEPKGKNVIKICDGTACHIRGSVSVMDALRRELGISPGETTEDGCFTVETVNCLGACAIAPVVVINGKYYPKVTAETLHQILEEYRNAEVVV